MILEEYDPEIVYNKGTDNIVADAVSRLEYDMDINTHNVNVHYRVKSLLWLFNSYVDTTLKAIRFKQLMSM